MTIGSNINVVPTSNIDTIAVNETTAIKALDALVDDEIHIEANAINFTDVILWVRKYPATDDNLKRGIPVFPGDTYPIAKRAQLYNGEYSMILGEAKATGDVFMEHF